ncbi:MAG: TetR/AcrR family transcriptional regulator [Myxococcota bacterium]|nr:TetR/AcrR family transcriptional regulator [Myxococcota bacterium]
MNAPTPKPAERLVTVALEVLENEGLEALTLRRVARRAGLSHGAPLRHFKSLAELRSAVAAHGFRLLHRSITEGAADLAPGAGAIARLEAAAHGYVRAAVTHPDLFALMFRPDRLDPTSEPFVRDSTAAFEQLVEMVRAAQDAGYHPERDSRVLAGTVWSTVHGLASLWAQGALPAVVPGASLEDALATLVQLVIHSNPQEP